MIWEVDEDCDRAVKWPEFQQMYHRCRHDKTGERCRTRCYILLRVKMLFGGTFCGAELTTDLPHQARGFSVYERGWYQQPV
jgi:hypothetical protein